MHHRLMLAWLSLALLAGCAGGGAGPSPAASPPPRPQPTPSSLPPLASPGTMTAPVAPSQSTTVPPAPSDPGAEAMKNYRISPEDLLEVQVFDVPELTRKVRVDSRGFISLPLIGSMQAAGLTSEELASVIEGKLAREYLQDPDVSIFILEFTSQRITLEGAVARPGVYPIKGKTTLLTAIASAEGIGKLADRSNVNVFRELPSGQKVMYTYDLDKIRSGEVGDPDVLGNDIVVVQRSSGRELLSDSMLRDFVNFLNPFKVMVP